MPEPRDAWKAAYTERNKTCRCGHPYRSHVDMPSTRGCLMCPECPYFEEVKGGVFTRFSCAAAE